MKGSKTKKCEDKMQKRRQSLTCISQIHAKRLESRVVGVFLVQARRIGRTATLSARLGRGAGSGFAVARHGACFVFTQLAFGTRWRLSWRDTGEVYGYEVEAVTGSASYPSGYSRADEPCDWRAVREMPGC